MPAVHLHREFATRGAGHNDRGRNLPRGTAIPIINKAIAQMETEDGWVGLGAVGQRLANIASDFDPRTYGYRKLSDLVRGTTPFDMEQPEGRGLRIRTKPAKPRKARPKVTTAD